MNGSPCASTTRGLVRVWGMGTFQIVGPARRGSTYLFSAMNIFCCVLTKALRTFFIRRGRVKLAQGSTLQMYLDNTFAVLWTECHDLQSGDEFGRLSNCLSAASFGKRPIIRHRRCRSKTFPKVQTGLAKYICRVFLALRQLPGREKKVLRAFETQTKMFTSISQICRPTASFWPHDLKWDLVESENEIRSKKLL